MTLDPGQVDALQELINIGIGRAAATLSELMQTHIELTIPGVAVYRVEDLPGRLRQSGGGRGVAISQDFEGPCSGRAALVLPRDSGVRLARVLAGVEDVSDELDLELSGILTEVGNIMINGVLGSLANVAGLWLAYGLPQFYGDQETAFAGWPGPGRATRSLLVADAHFRVRKYSIRGSLLCVLEREGLEAVLRGLEVAAAGPEEAR
jgi:chemotaxis protein CheC